MAQHARPNDIGQIELRRAQLTTLSSEANRIPSSFRKDSSSPGFSSVTPFASSTDMGLFCTRACGFAMELSYSAALHCDTLEPGRPDAAAGRHHEKGNVGSLRAGTELLARNDDPVGQGIERRHFDTTRHGSWRHLFQIAGFGEARRVVSRPPGRRPQTWG